MLINLSFTGIRVDGNIIIDGHHRYMASLLANYSLDYIACIRSQAKRSIDWESVKFVEEDWDTPAKIRILNEADARYNDMSVEYLLEKIK